MKKSLFFSLLICSSFVWASFSAKKIVAPTPRRTNASNSIINNCIVRTPSPIKTSTPDPDTKK